MQHQATDFNQNQYTHHNFFFPYKHIWYFSSWCSPLSSTIIEIYPLKILNIWLHVLKLNGSHKIQTYLWGFHVCRYIDWSSVFDYFTLHWVATISSNQHWLVWQLKSRINKLHIVLKCIMSHELIIIHVIHAVVEQINHDLIN